MNTFEQGLLSFGDELAQLVLAAVALNNPAYAGIIALGTTLVNHLNTTIGTASTPAVNVATATAVASAVNTVTSNLIAQRVSNAANTGWVPKK